MEPKSDSSHTTFRATDTESEEQLTPSLGHGTERDNLCMGVDAEDPPTCSGECHRGKKRFTVKKWNAVAMWAWGKPKLGHGHLSSSAKAD